MYVVIDLDVVLCIPHGHGCDEVRFGLGCQLQVPFDMVLDDSKPFAGHFSSGDANGQTGEIPYCIQLKFTSLKKSPCFLSSASIARSSIPPEVALQHVQAEVSDSVTVKLCKLLSIQTMQNVSYCSESVTTYSRKGHSVLIGMKKCKVHFCPPTN
jgi:hypothetical protein